MLQNQSPGAWLGLACLLAIIPAGCQSVSHRGKVDPAQAQVPPPGASGGSPDAKTSYQTQFGPRQQVNTHLDLGRAFETQGNFDAAIIEYQKALEACDLPGSGRGDAKVTKQIKALAQRRMAGALDRLGHFAQSENHYRQAMELSPNDVNVWNDAGYSYYLQSRWPDAERCLLTAAKLDPNNLRVQTNLGLALAAGGKPDKAFEALSRSGGPAVAHANLGYILAAIGNPVEARKHYQAALEMQPQFEAARFALAKLDGAPLPAPSIPGTAMASASPGPIKPSDTASVVVPPTAPAPAPMTASMPIVAPKPVSVTAAGTGSPALTGPVTEAAPATTVPSPVPVTSPAASAPRSPARPVAVISGTPPETEQGPGGPRQILTMASTATSQPPVVPAPAPAAGAPKIDPAVAASFTGIPLPQRATPRRTLSDAELSRASTQTGIPLPSGTKPAPTH